jgi:hypothetical protein
MSTEIWVGKLDHGSVQSSLGASGFENPFVSKSIQMYRGPGGLVVSGGFVDPGGLVVSGGFVDPGGLVVSGGFVDPGGLVVSGGFVDPGGLAGSVPVRFRLLPRVGMAAAR